MRRIKVALGERSYPIVIGSGILEGIAGLCAEAQFPVRSPLLIVSDSAVAPLYLSDLETRLKAGDIRLSVMSFRREKPRNL